MVPKIHPRIKIVFQNVIKMQKPLSGLLLESESALQTLSRTVIIILYLKYYKSSECL